MTPPYPSSPQPPSQPGGQSPQGYPAPQPAGYPNQQYPNQAYPNQQYPNPTYPNQPYPQPGYAPGFGPGAQPGAYTAVFKRHTGLLVIALTSPRQTTGSLADIRKAFWAAQAHCLTLGWWGIISALVYNWVAIFGNISELNHVKNLAAQYGDR